MQNKQDQINFYEGLLARHGENYKTLGWNSPESQRLRFRILQEVFLYGKRAAGISILDVGCGFGDLYGFLKSEGMISRHKINYTGYDIAPKILEVAKKKYPGVKFELKDILTERHLPKFDYVFCSGALNICTTGKEDHLEFVKEILFRMYDLGGCGVAVNFLSEGALPYSRAEDVDSGRYLFFNPEQILNYCRFVSGRYILRHDYHPGDFTLYLLK